MGNFFGGGPRLSRILALFFFSIGPGTGLAWGEDSIRFALADMDKDRDRDVVLASADALTVFLNSGNASLMATTPISATGVSRVATGDVNGNGHCDVVSLQRGFGTFALHMNSGNGQLQSGMPVPVGGELVDMALVDLDQDRDLDLAVARRAAGDVRFLFNDGTGHFPQSATITVGASPVLILPGDLDRDGLPDFVVVQETQPPRLLFLRNLGNLNFQGLAPLDLGFSPSGAVVADLTGDRFPDLAITDFEAESLRVYKNEGAFQFVAGEGIRAGSGPTTLAARDLDSDGDIDLAVANAPLVGEATRGVFLLFNEGAGTDFFSSLVHAPDNSVPLEVAIADMNGNCRPDILVALDRPDPMRVVLNEIEPPPLLPDMLADLLEDRREQSTEGHALFCGARRWYRQP